MFAIDKRQDGSWRGRPQEGRAYSLCSPFDLVLLLVDNCTAADLAHRCFEGNESIIIQLCYDNPLARLQISRNRFNELALILIYGFGRIADQGSTCLTDHRRNRTERQTSCDQSTAGRCSKPLRSQLTYRDFSARVTCNDDRRTKLDATVSQQLPEFIGLKQNNVYLCKRNNDERAHRNLQVF